MIYSFPLSNPQHFPYLILSIDAQAGCTLQLVTVISFAHVLTSFSHS